MAYRIGTNVDSLSALNGLRRTATQVEGNLRRLASGRRLASASDDAAGIARSARLDATTRSLTAARRNVQDGLSLARTAEGGLDSITDSLVRMRELAVQAANGTLSATDRDGLQSEIDQLRDHMDQTALGTSFNGIALLAEPQTITLRIGADATAGVDTLDVTTLAARPFDLGVNALDVTSSSSARTAISDLDQALLTVTTQRGALGAVQARLDSTLSSLAVRDEHLSAARSRITDLDVARETAEYTKLSLLHTLGLDVLVKANQQPAVAVGLL